MSDTTRAHRLFDALAWLAYGLAVLKMAVVVFARPVFGYANSYDFLRQSACTGLWQAVAGVHKYEASYRSTAPHLLYDGEKLPAFCLFSSDNLFPWLAGAFHDVGDTLDWAWIAWPKLLLVAVPAALLLARMTPGLRLTGASAFLLIFGDPAYLGYVNTLYTDFSVIGAAVLLALAVASRMARSGSPDRSTHVIALLALGWLGASKLQYAFLACLAGLLYAGWWAARRRGRLALAVALIGCSGPVAYLSINGLLNDQLQAFRQVNRIDTVFGAVLPAAPDPARALASLELSPSCQELIGKSWYVADGPRQRPCEGLDAVGYRHLLGLFLDQPATFFQPLAEGLRQARPLYPTYLANRQGLDGFVPDPSWLARRTAASHYLAQVPEPLYLALFPLSLALGGAAVLGLALWSDRLGGNGRGAGALIGFGGLYAGYAMGSSVFGDGYIEVQKHTALYGVGLFLQCAAGFAIVMAWLERRSRSATRAVPFT